MNRTTLCMLLILVLPGFDSPLLAEQPEPAQRWSLDDADSDAWTVYGKVTGAAGVQEQSLMFDGHSLVEFNDSTTLTYGDAGFTLLAWVNPYALNHTQQMVIGKNRYALNEREWGVMIDADNRFRLYVWQGKWITIGASNSPRPGHWHQLGVVVHSDRAELWVDGEQVGEVTLSKPLSRTAAPVTISGINDNGRIRQNLVGAIDEVQLFNKPLNADQLQAAYQPISETHNIPFLAHGMNIDVDPSWSQQLERHREQDRSSIVFDGHRPNQLACDTTLRKLPDGSWVMIMLGGGDTEPVPQNRVFISRSLEEGMTWSPVVPIDLGIKSKNPDTALVPSELMVHDGRCTLFVATHDGTFADWKEWMTHSDDSCRTWSPLVPAPGRLRDRTFIRNHIVTRDGRMLLPFQHYTRVAETKSISNSRRFSAPTDPRNGVLMSSDGGKTWTEHGDIRISANDNYHGWAENNIVELSDDRVAMIIRADGLGGVLYYAESTDGGRTWPEFARPTTIPNPGSKATLYSLGGESVALLHNPNPRHRSPLALWISFDGMQSWPYQRVLVPESVDGPSGRLNYPDGFVSDDGRYLHFAFDDNRHRGVYYGATLPERLK